MVKGKTIDEALKLTNKDVVNKLGGLPPVKLHCSVLAEEAIKNAVKDYYKKQGVLSEEEITLKTATGCSGDCHSCCPAKH